ncbi:MAG TPA: acetyl ornithine aminotransferase family protein [Nitrospiria bacterium]|nr:acetyl ornithine aminotransferase family protein [Nitrospiria bacterium]
MKRRARSSRNARRRVARPGPKARSWLRRDRRALSPSLTRVYPLVVARASGATVTDVDGRRYLDFTSGIAVTGTGHCHPDVVDAITRQARTLIHMSGTDFYYPSEIRLAERLIELAPGRRAKQCFLANSGTESTEAAMKLARYATGRPYFVAFLGGFHGRTYGAMSLSASKPVHKQGFGPLVPGVVHVPYADCYRCPYGLTPDRCNLYCVSVIEDEVFRRTVPAEEVAAIVVEPIQGEGGYVVPPDGYLTALQALARKYGILLMVDEIQTGMGRTGRMWGCDHDGVEPDLMMAAKGIASGLPLGAMIADARLMCWPSGAHANTFGGNPVACEAALVTLRLLMGGLIERAAAVGRHLLDRCRELQARHRLVGDVRGRGLMIGVELVTDRERKTPAVRERDRVIECCFQRGLLLLGCGRSVLRLVPPLIITRRQADNAVSLLDEVIGDVERRSTAA